MPAATTTAPAVSSCPQLPPLINDLQRALTQPPPAVIAKAYTTRDGAGDCAAFLRTTTTPPVVTVTATATESFSVTSTESATETTLTTSTLLSTDVLVVKETASETTTVTVVTAALRKREDAAPTIPAYASPCSGAARYSTACACVGVSMTTIEAATPTVTVTVTESTTASFAETTTVSTEVIVSTSTSIESTTTTTTDATATATQTAVVAPALFRLRSTSGGTKNQFVKQQIGGTIGSVASTLGFTKTLGEAATFSFGANGQLNQVSGSTSAPLQAKSNDSKAPVVVSKLNGNGLDFSPAVCGFTGVKLTCAWASSPTVVRTWAVPVTIFGSGSLQLGNSGSFLPLSQNIELEIVAA